MQLQLRARALLDQYCVTCHNEKAKTAGLMLDKLDIANVGQNAASWEKVVRKLRVGAMPPQGMPRPDRATMDSLAASIETSLDRAAAAAPNPGQPVLHRLNRTEYANAIRDLLALDVDRVRDASHRRRQLRLRQYRERSGRLARAAGALFAGFRARSAAWPWAIRRSIPSSTPIAYAPTSRKTNTSKACRSERVAAS